MFIISLFRNCMVISLSKVSFESFLLGRAFDSKNKGLGPFRWNYDSRKAARSAIDKACLNFLYQVSS